MSSISIILCDWIKWIIWFWTWPKIIFSCSNNGDQSWTNFKANLWHLTCGTVLFYDWQFHFFAFSRYHLTLTIHLDLSTHPMNFSINYFKSSLKWKRPENFGNFGQFLKFTTFHLWRSVDEKNKTRKKERDKKRRNKQRKKTEIEKKNE